AYLRMKNYDSAISAFDAALEAYPQDAASLYGRALAREGKGDSAGADAELAAARQSYPTITQELASLGLDLGPPPELAALSPAAAPTSAASVRTGTPQPPGETALLPPAGAAGNPPSEQTTSSAAPAEEMTSLPLAAAVAEALIQRGNDLLRTGDIVSARFAFERAASSGNETAAVGVAKTYDPIFLAQNGVRGLRGDPARAAFWYGKAAATGSREARERLTRLRAQFPQ
ncbi:MAG: tetratricopeptide repeat protein, partial [Stellaceae bacterium]